MSHSEEATLADPADDVRIARSDSVSEAIDPRIAPGEVATEKQLDEPYLQQASHYLHHREDHKHCEKTSTQEVLGERDDKEDPLYVEFEKDDARNPLNFTTTRKWTISLTAITFTALSAANASSYNLGFRDMVQDFHTTEFKATIALSTYALGFGLTPLVTASFSEEFGREPLYIVSCLGFAMMHLVVAVAKNIHTVQVARFFQGAFGSTGSTMVGGTIADLFLPHERGLPMSIFSVAAVGFTGLGAVVAGWVDLNKHLGWRWIQWIHFIFAMALFVAIPLLMKETRSAVVLTRIAKSLRKKTGNSRYRARIEDERASLKTLIWISCTRPVYLLLTEPVVASFSIWVGFAWGILYGLIESIGPVFTNLHQFNDGQVGTVFVTFFIGSVLGCLTNNLYQERLYRKNLATRGPEARLYLVMVAAVSLPAALFIYAWCTFPNVHWISLCIAITLIEFSCFIIYQAVFTYLADCYGTYASSALAGQSLSRNLFGMAFPLFTQQMYATLTYKWANTLFALLAVIMMPIPYILFFYGPKLRARSKFALALNQKS